jgi:hypothetical protein
MDRSKRRGYPLRVWRRGIDAQPRVRRRVLARQDPLPEPEPDVDIVRGIWGDDYPSDAIARNYSSWGCSPPSPTDRRMD